MIVTTAAFIKRICIWRVQTMHFKITVFTLTKISDLKQTFIFFTQRFSCTRRSWWLDRPDRRVVAINNLRFSILIKRLIWYHIHFSFFAFWFNKYLSWKKFSVVGVLLDVILIGVCCNQILINFSMDVGGSSRLFC